MTGGEGLVCTLTPNLPMKRLTIEYGKANRSQRKTLALGEETRYNIVYAVRPLAVV